MKTVMIDEPVAGLESGVKRELIPAFLLLNSTEIGPVFERKSR
jgi:hypothetical protein